MSGCIERLVALLRQATGRPRLDASAARKKRDDDFASPLFDEGDGAAFASACGDARALTGLPAATRLRLYGLYKQATEGDAPASAPSMGVLDPAAQLKWRAWSNLQGTPAAAARDQYVHAVRCAAAGDEDDGGGGDSSADEAVDAEALALEDAMGTMAGPVMSALSVSAEEEAERDAADENFPLHAAARQGDAARCRTLVARRGRSVDARDEDEHTALHWACDGGHVEAAEALLQHGAAVDARNCDGTTPLYMACACGHVGVAKLLCVHGASPRAADSDGSTPLELVEGDDAWAFLSEA